MLQRKVFYVIDYYALCQYNQFEVKVEENGGVDSIENNHIKVNYCRGAIIRYSSHTLCILRSRSVPHCIRTNQTMIDSAGAKLFPSAAVSIL
jgi:hypothetical protein